MSCNSCSGVFEANAVQTDDEAITEYWKQLEVLGEQGMLPELQQQLWYHVYTIEGGGFCGHKSVVLSSNNIHFVTVELNIRQKNGRLYVYPKTRALAQEHHSKLAYYGKVVKSGYQLIETALNVMIKFGSYNQVCRNCHDYCRMFIEAIGL